MKLWQASEKAKRRSWSRQRSRQKSVQTDRSRMATFNRDQPTRFVYFEGKHCKNVRNSNYGQILFDTSFLFGNLLTMAWSIFGFSIIYEQTKSKSYILGYERTERRILGWTALSSIIPSRVLGFSRCSYDSWGHLVVSRKHPCRCTCCNNHPKPKWTGKMEHAI